MGEVYLAQDTRLDRSVALKLLPPDLASDAKRLRRFRQEAKLAAALHHPNVCIIHEVGDAADGQPFIAMEYIEGQTLAATINQQPLALSAILTFAIQITDALDEAHSKGIIHRDLKPANILITSRQQAKVLDFGLAKLTAPVEPVSVSELPTQPQTDPGTIMGTVPYMSPEQARGKEVDARSDIFSFGIVLYEMVTGRLPFPGATMTEILDRILHAPPEAIARFNYNAPQELERIIRKCLEKEKERRYQSAKELLVDLQNLKRDTDSGAEPTKPYDVKPEGTKPYDAQLEVTKEAIATDANAARTTAADGRVGWRTALTSWRGRVIALLIVILLGGLAYVLFWRKPAIASQPPIKSLAILPLKSLDAGENYLGLGIADAVIRRINQTGELIVRPTSAVRRYLNDDTDALTAAQQLKADAVLEGNVQRENDRLRVSVNLLRAVDGSSLWSESFDMHSADIFTIQDAVSHQVASHLRLQLNPEQQARLTKRSTSNPIAYEFYVKGVYNLDQRSEGKNAKPQAEVTMNFFKKAIDADPNFALAHAQLAYVFAWIANFIEQTEPMWVEQAKEEINRAETLDPQLAETHIARHLLLFSAYEGWQNEAAVRELLLAQQLNPNIGHADLGSVYTHLGLEDLAARELQRAIEIDPTSTYVKNQILGNFFIVNKYDEWLAAAQKFFDGKPDSWYFMGKGRLDEAQKIIEEALAKVPDNPLARRRKATFLALKGDYRAAEAEIPVMLSNEPRFARSYHHLIYDIACIYALAGKTQEAVNRLREVADRGFPCYPLFERDPYLNRIRQTPVFIEFMNNLKPRWEKLKQEFD